MSHVLVSYKREDEARVARLVRALQHHGLDIWWDKHLPGGEAWRANIETALNEAGCVLVVWTRSSVGPEGEFVRDEAGRGKARGVLVPVRLDKVSAPLGFGEIQAIDLSKWRGGMNSPAILDVVAACRAKLENRPAPPAKAPGRALFQRVAVGSSITALALGALSFVTNMFATQTTLCALPVGQPGLADACGALRLGGQPSHEERIAWAARRPGSCADLRALINRFPDGAYRGRAQALLQAATFGRAAGFSPAPRTARGYVRQSEHPFASESAAQGDARARASADAAQTTCAPVDETERLAGADLGAVSYDCRPSPLGGWSCAADYAVTCRIETRVMTETCG
jgi:hypothetical protein